MESGSSEMDPSGVNQPMAMEQQTAIPATVKLTCQKDFNPSNQCILCLKPHTPNNKLTSTPNGMEKVKVAAETRRDEAVMKRIQSSKTFSYHLGNRCYKIYTMTNLLESIKKNRTQPELSTPPTADDNRNTPATRSRISSMRHAASPLITSTEKRYEIKCIICDKVKNGQIRDKFRISEDIPAKEFLEAVKCMNDDVKVRLADIDSVERLKAADIHYHKNCFRAYLARYEKMSKICILCLSKISTRSIKPIDNDIISRLLQCSRVDGNTDVTARLHESFDETDGKIKQSCYAHSTCISNYLDEYTNVMDLYQSYVQPMVSDIITKGYGISLSDIRDSLSQSWPGIPFYNHKPKLYLKKAFGDQISFCQPYRKEQSEVVYSSLIDPSDMVAKTQVLDTFDTAGKLLRSKLREVDFGLQDSFCDKTDLMESMLQTRIPESLITFLCAFLNINKADFVNLSEEKIEFVPDEPDESEGPETDVDQKFNSTKKMLKAHSLFQVMHYMVNNGKRKSPLPVMISHTIYNKCKSREIITSLNNLGLSISYNELRKCRNNLGAYALNQDAAGLIPLPSHFQDDEFTIAAMDNFDHIDRSSSSGKNDNHDSVMVLFQNKSVRTRNKSKGKVSDLGIRSIGRKYMTDILDCQKVSPCWVAHKDQPLPENFRSYPFKYEPSDDQKLLSFIRNSDTEDGGLTPTWQGICSLISVDTVPVKNVGFLPIIPHPITKIETVYSCLRNFKYIASQLKQQTLPVVCDEGVYLYVIKIYLDRPEFFDNIFPMLGSFHMTKAALRCAGTYLEGSGVVDAFVEENIYGQKTQNAVMTGGHYYRSLEGLVMIQESIQILQWKAFTKVGLPTAHNEALEMVKNLRKSLQNKDPVSSKKIFEEIRSDGRVKSLILAFDQFKKQCADASQQCHYWEFYVYIMDVIKNLVKADRQGDFLLHIKSVGDLLPIFLGCDGVNYQRYGTFYWELLKGLHDQHPELYESFLQGGFVIKTKKGSFNAVATDMALEQSINKSAKSSKGIIGTSKKVDYITEWTLVYHEVLDIVNTFRNITSADIGGNTETQISHHLSNQKIKEFEKNLNKMTTFMEMHGNPFCINQDDIKLKNFVTQMYATDMVAETFLEFPVEIVNEFENYQKNVYIHRTSLLSNRITKFNLLPIDHKDNQKSTNTKDVKFSEKQSRKALKTLMIAKGKFGNVAPVLRYDITSYSYLFDGNKMTSGGKSKLIEEIENRLSPSDYDFTCIEEYVTVVDFMSFIRNQKVDRVNFKTFGSCIEELFNRIITVYNNTTILHFIFDSYISGSWKGSERKERVKGLVHLANITAETPLPVQMETFWGSERNKQMMQKFACEILQLLAIQKKVNTVMSGVIEIDVALPAKYVDVEHASSLILADLTFDMEEADLRIIPHIKWNLTHNPNMVNFVVVSRDTDVIVLLLFYFKQFTELGLRKLWIVAGTGDKKRYISIHRIFEIFGEEFCKVLLKLHIGTGCDYISKIGTKRNALKADPVQLLKNFGEYPILDDMQIKEAEKYLVRVFDNKTTVDTFDELRYVVFRKSNSVFELPPTSFSITKGHIPRWWFLYKQCSNLLSEQNIKYLNAIDYGWNLVENELIPDKNLNLLPDDLSIICKCKNEKTDNGCSSNRCKCRKQQSHCTDYCLCVKCKNTS